MTLTYPQQLQLTNRILSGILILLLLSTGYFYGKDAGWFQSHSQPVSYAYPTPVENRDDRQGVDLGKSTGLLVMPLSQTLSTNILHHTYDDEALTLAELGSLLWAAQGTITPWGDRTAPSYKAVFPIEMRVLVRNVENMVPGLYAYEPETGKLVPTAASRSADLVISDQPESLNTAPVVLGLVAKPADYGEMNQATADQLKRLDAGMIAENALLASQSIGLGAAYFPNVDLVWNDIFGTSEQNQVVLLMPVGKPKDTQVQATPAVTGTLQNANVKEKNL